MDSHEHIHEVGAWNNYSPYVHECHTLVGGWKEERVHVILDMHEVAIGDTRVNNQ